MLIILLLLIGGVFSACSPNCLLCDAPRNFCYACTEPLLPMLGGGCAQVSQVSGCLLYLTNGICAKCKLGHRPTTDNMCLKDPNGCLRFSAGGVCLECGFGMNLVSGGCSGILNCLEYNQESLQICLKCLDGFDTFDIKCYANNYCETANKQDGTCSTCKRGASLSGFGCAIIQTRVLGCSVYGMFGQCLYCEEGLAYNDQGQCQISNSNNTLSGYALLSINRTRRSIPVLGSRTAVSSALDLRDTNCQAYDSLGICISCNEGYYLNITKCLLASPTCDGFNVLTGECLACKPEYTLAPKGQCIRQKKVDPNCNIPSASGGCIACIYGYYLANNTCTQVSWLCVGYNLLTGDCLTCPQGYSLDSGRCKPLPSANAPSQTCRARLQSNPKFCLRCIDGYRLTVDGVCEAVLQDPNCKTIVNDQCKACSAGYYLNNQFACSQVNPQCATYDPNNGYCLTCYPGYKIVGSTCMPANTEMPASLPVVRAARTSTRVLTSFKPVSFDPNCAESTTDGECLKCSIGFFQSGGKCLQVNVQCRTSNDTTGECLSCYDGYDLRTGSCIESSTVDPACVIYTNSSCTQCLRDHYLNSSKQCVAVSRTCETFQQTTGVCTGCRIGYKVSSVDAHYCVDENCLTYNGEECQSCVQPYFLVNNTCTILVILQKEPANCAIVKNSSCAVCIGGYFVRNGSCVQVSPLCATSDPVAGFCLSCYNGFALQAGNCFKISLSPNCRIMQDGLCKECSTGYWLNASSCQLASNLCKTFDNTTGRCTSCYPGYTLLEVGDCRIPMIDTNCLTVMSGKCSACKESYTLSSEGSCVRRINLCATVDKASGKCATCFPGYQLVGSECSIQFVPNVNCKTNNGKVCTQCIYGFILKNGDCQQVSQLCEKFDNNTGNCTSCFPGYQLSAGACELKKPLPNPLSPAALALPNTSCKEGMYFNGKTCIAVSILCLKFDYSAKKCLSCQEGTVMQDNDCIMPSLGVDTNCIRYTNSYCSACTQDYFLENYLCTAIDKNCTAFNSTTNTCEKCRSGMQPDGARCI